MPNKAINEFNTVGTLYNDDIFLINQNGTTSTTTLSTIRNNILPTGSNGQVLTYNGSTNTWVASAGEGSNFTGLNQLLSSNGYQKLPGGLIMQWGSVPDTGQTYNFPIPFTTQCFNIVASLTGDTWDGAGETRVHIVNLSSFRVRVGGTPDNSNQIAMWQAFGK